MKIYYANMYSGFHISIPGNGNDVLHTEMVNSKVPVTSILT